MISGLPPPSSNEALQLQTPRVWEEATLSANPEACTEAAHKACPRGRGQGVHPHAHHTPTQESFHNLLGLDILSKIAPASCSWGLTGEGRRK